jgi:predicted O-methyltransferase YrrM
MDINSFRRSTVLDESIYSYVLLHQPPEHDELRALRQRTATMPDGHMQIAPEQGHLLAFLIRLIGARRGIEVGTFTGYSALAIALALPSDGELLACDVSVEWTGIGRRYWERAGVASKIDLRIAPALETLNRLEAHDRSGWDFAFIDADKPAYEAYYESTLRLVRPGGLIALDNMLRRGRVADPCQSDADTTAIRTLNDKIAKDDRVDHVLLAVAGGMTLVRRRH